MEEIGESLSLLFSTSPVKTAVDEIRTHLRPSTAKAIADLSTPESKILALEEKLESLTRLSDILLGHKDKIKRVVDDLNSEAIKVEDELVELDMPDIPPSVLIHFVDVMDQANQYFDLKEYAKLAFSDLKPTTSRTGIYHFLLLNQQLLSEFSKIGEPQIRQAANAVFWELFHEQSGNRYTKPKMDPALLDLIHNLVYKTRVKGYVMDQDPIAQLRKMMKSKPFFYKNYFLNQQLPVECTERSIEDARDKYSRFLGIMSAKYKEASSEMHKVTSIPTSAGNKQAFNEKQEFTSTASSANEKGFSEKHKITSTSTFAENEEEFSEKRPFMTTGAVDTFPHKRKRDQESKNGWASVPSGRLFRS